MNNDITEQYLEKVYEDFSREQMSLMTEMKNSKDPEQYSKQKDIQKQLTALNALMIGVLRYRNLKKDIARKANL